MHLLRYLLIIYEQWNRKEKGQNSQISWNEKFAAYKLAHPELANEYERRVIKGELPAQFEAKANAFIAECHQNSEKYCFTKSLTKRY